MISYSLRDVIISCDSSVLRWLHIHSVFCDASFPCYCYFLVCNVLYVFSSVIYFIFKLLGI